MLTADQIKIRRTGIGASEIAAIVGLNPWRSALDVWLEKTGRAQPFAGNARTSLGEILEPHIIDWWVGQRGATELAPLGTLRDAEHDWLLATPDHHAHADGADTLVEAKFVGHFVRRYWGDVDALPDYVTTQLQVQMRVSGIHRAECAAWIDGEREPERARRIIPCPYSPELVDDLIELGSEFWMRYVQKDVEPPVDHSDAWARYLRGRYPRERQPMVLGTPETDALVGAWSAAHREIKRAEARKDKAAYELQRIIGDRAGIFRAGKYRVSWLLDAHGSTSWKSIVQALLGTEESQAEGRTLVITPEGARAIVAKNTGAPSRRFTVREF